ncbi:flagellar hook-length control protein FliK [Allosphingosinicella deserti]|uniref:Flagellar hook-length control protein-like C-terminal domain-containing protein n=1 Tax=Allosphingosinicella deserti TaxID=2116704 RepID=A0A2P7QNZ4_9SPHN|nr:flagellar hook-length control protein FliK [Sphingomonas deserti]PSJ39677.1 hypothetical protein C7I55_13880 [Sphingomonas deserti]
MITGPTPAASAPPDGVVAPLSAACDGEAFTKIIAALDFAMAVPVLPTPALPGAVLPVESVAADAPPLPETDPVAAAQQLLAMATPRSLKAQMDRAGEGSEPAEQEQDPDPDSTTPAGSPVPDPSVPQPISIAATPTPLKPATDQPGDAQVQIEGEARSPAMKAPLPPPTLSPSNGKGDGAQHLLRALAPLLDEPGVRPALPARERPTAGKPLPPPIDTLAPIVATPTFAPQLTAPALDVSQPLAAPEATAEAVAIERQLDLAQDGEWLDQLARDIARSAGEAGPLRFRLNPETLGSLHVEITPDRGGAAIRLTTDTEAARTIIADAQPRLVAEARAQGVRISEAHVDLSSQQGSADQRHRQQLFEQAPPRTARLLQEERTSDGKPTARGSELYA